MADARPWYALPVEAIEVDWEFPELDYTFVLEWSNEGQAWNRLADGASRGQAKRVPVAASSRFLRVRAVGLPNDKWASIREIRLLDGDGKLIKNRTLPGGATPAAIEFDDSTWRTLNVPHDWGVEGPFRDDLPGDTGKLPWKGIGWYRKHFHVPASDLGKRLFIDFDGAMADAKVWLNGQYVGTWPYGYQPFRLELTPFVKFGADNVLAVRLDTAQWGSRWYPGAGIYRNVWLVKTSPVHVGHWGVYITTPSITDQEGKAKLAVTVDNQGGEETRASVQTEIFELATNGMPGTKIAASAWVTQSLAAGKSAVIELDLAVPQPRRWDLETRNRYLARTSVRTSDKLADVYDQPFGFRTIEFTPREGFKLNGRRVQVQGVCNHHDLGPLGAGSTCGRSRGSSRFSRKWAVMRSGLRTILPHPSCWTWPIAWASW